MNEQLARLRQLVEARKVECPTADMTHFGRTPPPPGCPMCHGTGQVPDPAFALMLEVLREPRTWTDFDEGRCSREEARAGYITRSWEGLPKGALAGALFFAWCKTGMFFPSLDFWGAKNPDQAALDAEVEEMMKPKEER